MKINQIEFFYLNFFYDSKKTLIPRFETEYLVRKAIEIVNKNDIDWVFDFWTWTWIIPISIEKNTNKNFELFWFDISEEALGVAKSNINLHNSRLKVYKSDLLKDIDLDFFQKFKNKNILITANLPYVKNNDWENMSEDTKAESHLALFWWKNTWFELYEKYFNSIDKLRKQLSFNKIFILSEIWYNQKNIATQCLNKIWFKHQYIKDNQNIDRIIFIKIDEK